jgi:D-tyrosyl-tRNA(Tyr) deacylase
MRVVLQRVARAKVTVEERITGEIGYGLLLLVGIHHNDTQEQMKWMCEKILKLRVFADDQGK